MTYRITTPYGSRYLVNDQAQIQRLDQHHTPSDSWTLVGVTPTHPFQFARTVIPFDQLHTITDWTYKNGNPRYTLVDCDHGTVRYWGNTEYHGIRSCVEVA